MTAIQLTLTISENGTLSAEVPSKNGARRKIELRAGETAINISIDSLAVAIRNNSFLIAEELKAQYDSEAQRKRDEIARQRKLTKETKLRNIEYIAAHYPRELERCYPGVTVRHTKSNAFFVVPKETRINNTTRVEPNLARAEKLTKLAAKIAL